MKLKKQDALIGRQLGDYQLLQRFATGGMAKIYKGVDVHLGRHAAVKVLTKDMLDADEMLSIRFQREAQAVAHLDHEHIVPIYQYGEEEDLYFLAMKFIDGEDFADEINRVQRSGTLVSVNRMLHILRQIAGALDYAHLHGVIHRDIKPSNILVDRMGKAYLTDFGLVLRQQVDQTMGTAFGTPRYISPEQALASEKVVAQSDVYSLAVIVFEIVTGSMIYKADTAMQLALSHISEPPPPPRSLNAAIPEPVENEILKALEKDPLKRHQTARDFIGALENAYGDLTDTQPEIPEKASTYTPLFRPAELDREIEKHMANDPTLPPPASVIPSPVMKNAPQPDPAPRRRRSRVPVVLFLILLIAAVGAAGAVALTAAKPDADTPTPAPPTQTAANVPTIERFEPAVLQYNVDALAVRNDSDQDWDVHDVVFARADGTNALPLNSQQVVNQTIPAGTCVVILMDTRPIDIPSEWDCETVHTEIRIPAASFFWRMDGAGTFELRAGDSIIATCDAVQRGTNGTCSFKW